MPEDTPVNTDELELTLYRAERRVREIQTKLHRWAVDEPHRRRILDPCCGSGTLLHEALSVSWEAVGSDVDPEAVAITRENVPRAVVEQADVLTLPHGDATFDAVVSNLPFGRQFHVEDPARWLRRALTEMARLTRPGGRAVVLVPPPVPRSLGDLSMASSYPLRLLGVSTRIWAFDRDQTQHGDASRDRQGTAAAHS